MPIHGINHGTRPVARRTIDCAGREPHSLPTKINKNPKRSALMARKPEIGNVQVYPIARCGGVKRTATF